MPYSTPNKQELSGGRGQIIGFPLLYAPMLIRVWARVRAWVRARVRARVRIRAKG